MLFPHLCREALRSGCAEINMVDAEIDEIPLRSLKVPRNREGKLFVDSIEKGLASRGLVLVGIGKDGYPAHRDGWTINTSNTSPVQLIVASKPGMIPHMHQGCLCEMSLIFLCKILKTVFYLFW